MHEPLNIFLAAYGAMFVVATVLCSLGFRRVSPLRRHGLVALTYAAGVPVAGTFALVVAVLFDTSQGGPMPIAAIFIPGLMLLSSVFLATAVVLNMVVLLRRPSHGSAAEVPPWSNVNLLFSKFFGIAFTVVSLPYLYLLLLY